MSTINAGNPTLLDLAQRSNPNGSMAKIVESLTKANPLLEDMTFQEGNLPTGHLYTRRVGLPDVTWRKLNGGVAPSKSRTAQITETCGILSGMSKVDRRLADLSGDAMAFRGTEDKGFLQAMKNELEKGLFYHNQASAPEKITGFGPRLNSLSGETAGQVISSTAGGSPSGADQTSVFLIVWGPETVYGITPKGLPAGLTMTDMGLQLTKDSGGTNEFPAWVSFWEWNMGLCVQDTRYIARLCNIDTTSLAKTGKLLIEDLVTLCNSVQDLDAGRPVLYMNRYLQTYLQQQSIDSTKGSTLMYDDVGGKKVTSFMGIPIRRTDAITITESVVT